MHTIQTCKWSYKTPQWQHSRQPLDWTVRPHSKVMYIQGIDLASYVQEHNATTFRLFKAFVSIILTYLLPITYFVCSIRTPLLNVRCIAYSQEGMYMPKRTKLLVTLLHTVSAWDHLVFHQFATQHTSYLVWFQYLIAYCCVSSSWVVVRQEHSEIQLSCVASSWVADYHVLIPHKGPHKNTRSWNGCSRNQLFTQFISWSASRTLIT